MSTHYINNADFLQALKEYKASIREAEESGSPPPRVTNYLGECILKIATHLSYKPNFINYTYRDEMVGDGVENCLMYIGNFDPDKSSNPFAYFTQIVWYAFIRRIQKEKKQTLIKGKIIMEMPFDSFNIQEHDEDGTYTSSYLDFVQNNGIFNDIIQKDETRKRRASVKKKTATLDDIIESDDIVE